MKGRNSLAGPLADPAGDAGFADDHPERVGFFTDTSAESPVPVGPVGSPARPGSWRPVVRGCSMNATCRHEFAPSEPVLSNDMPSRSSPSSGTAFHVLQATSQALHPMHTEVSVKNPTRSGWSPA